MPSPKIRSISIIGAGNVAHHLAIALYKRKYKIDYVCNRSIYGARKLSARVGGKATTSYRKVLSSDAIVVAVSDGAIPAVSRSIATISAGAYPGVIMHTAGSVASEVLSVVGHHYGSLYPFQTFSIDRELDMRDVPFYISASDESTRISMVKLGRSLSNQVSVISDEQRHALHLSGVMMNNFVNHLLHKAEEYLLKYDLDRHHLLSLISETISKVAVMSPFEAQTGPARRKDIETIEGHQDRLKHYPELREIYSTITTSIIKTYHENNR